MSKRTMVVLLVAAALVGAGGATAVAVTMNRASVAQDQECVTAKERAEAVVHTDPIPIANRLAVLGRYTAIHWQVRDPGACSGGDAAGPRTYQAMVKLRPADTRVLMKDYKWLIADSFDSEGMWPGLAELVPPGTRWQTSWQVDDILLDPARSIAYAFITA